MYELSFLILKTGVHIYHHLLTDSNYERVYYLLQHGGKTMVSAKTKALEGKRWEGGGGYLDKRVLRLLTMLK